VGRNGKHEWNRRGKAQNLERDRQAASLDVVQYDKMAVQQAEEREPSEKFGSGHSEEKHGFDKDAC
jgi:hypothetical protein